MLTRVKRESLGKYEAEPRRLYRLFTLHDASLDGHVGAKRLKVNQGPPLLFETGRDECPDADSYRMLSDSLRVGPGWRAPCIG